MSLPPPPKTRARLYLAGPMSGYPDHNFPAFHAEAKRLRALGFDVVNPAEIQKPDWASAMRADIAQLTTCDVISFLPGWEHSKGACLEHHIAKELGIVVLHQPPKTPKHPLSATATATASSTAAKP